MADHDDPLAIARDIISATRDCGICGGSGVREIGTACACGSGKVHVYGPNVRFLAEAFVTVATLSSALAPRVENAMQEEPQLAAPDGYAQVPLHETASLLAAVGVRKPGCYCNPGKCMAPSIMGRAPVCLDPERAGCPG